MIPQAETLAILSYPHYRETPWALFNSFSLTIWMLIGLSFTIFGLFGHLKYIKSVQSKSELVWQMTVANYIDLFALFIGLGKSYTLKLMFTIKNVNLQEL